MLKELECPLCKTMNEVPDDCHEPDVMYECTCDKCGKIFGFTLEYYASYTEHKLPCANGEPHDWQPIHGIPEEFFAGKRRCSYCDEETTLESIEKAKAAMADKETVEAVS